MRPGRLAGAFLAWRGWPLRVRAGKGAFSSLSTPTIAAASLATQTSLRSLRKFDCACGFVTTP